MTVRRGPPGLGRDAARRPAAGGPARPETEELWERRGPPGAIVQLPRLPAPMIGRGSRQILIWIYN